MAVFAKSGFVLRIFAAAAVAAGIVSISKAQSTNQATPTAVTANEIRGAIPARDVGDPRLTNHFYQLSGNQGDVFINVVTENLDGDIDVFLANGLKPLTKITLFSDASNNETGRVVYLRESGNLLLRVQARSPNDAPGSYRIKFAGSFVPLESTAETEVQSSPEVTGRDQGRIQVNSVGTIIEPAPKPVHKTEEAVAQLPPPDAAKVERAQVPDAEAKTAAQMDTEETNPRREVAGEPAKDNIADKAAEKSADSDVRRAKELVIINVNPLPEDVPGIAPETRSKLDKPAKDGVSAAAEPIAEGEKPPEKSEAKANANDVPAKNAAVESAAAGTAAIGPVDPSKLTKVQLTVTLKDGRIVKHKINNIFSFNVTQGVLRIILNDGSISRYSLLDVDKIAIEEIKD